MRRFPVAVMLLAAAVASAADQGNPATSPLGMSPRRTRPPLGCPPVPGIGCVAANLAGTGPGPEPTQPLE